MRINIVHPGADELQYEIRGIVDFAQKVSKTGKEIIWENIGDPVNKGEKVPDWITDIVASAAKEQMSYAYSPTRGLQNTLVYLSKSRSLQTGQALSPNNIIFFNGLGDAITKVYTWLNPIARVLGPSPAYPTHSSVEGAHGRSQHMTYNLDPEKDWMPDMDDIRNKVKYNPSIAALLIINPDNPTGTVYSKDILQQFVDIARENNLFLISDEIYANLVYQGQEFVSIAEMCKDVPTIAMRGLSKEVPWPGSRCGWLEIYNSDKDQMFQKYTQSLLEAKMIEVCSTTLPQQVLPDLLSNKKYTDYLQSRTKMYEKKADLAVKILKKTNRLNVVKPKGAFYLTVTPIKGNKLKAGQNKVSKEAIKLVNQVLGGASHQDDKIFCYQMLAETGICTVPLTSGFNSWVSGFRMTLLEPDIAKFEKTLNKIADFVT